MEYTFGEAPLFGQRFGWRYNELVIWGWKKKHKTLYPFCEHQNSWDLWMFIPLKMEFIGIDP